MSEFCCFAHPRLKGLDLTSQCPQCGRPYSFPLDTPPLTIDGETVEAALDRGFYGAVYRTRNLRTGLRFAVKVSPQAAYSAPDPSDSSKGGYGDRKSFEDESRLHASLSDCQELASVITWGDEDVKFGDTVIPCHWTRMEYIEGRSLRSLIENGPRSPREALQIAKDLLSLLTQLGQRDVFHNDLHAGNAFIMDVPRNRQRRDAIEPSVMLKVFDLGSAARKDAAKPGPLEAGGRLSDIEQVASHILGMLAAYEENQVSDGPVDMRLSAQLRRVAEYYQGECRRDDIERMPKPQDMIDNLHTAWMYAERPTSHPGRLQSMSLHINAQTLPPALAGPLLFDPDDGAWATRLIAPGPQLIAGMRGCGKTMLLRSLEWTGRVHLRVNEGESGRARRLKEENYLGLFVTCASLLGNKPRTGQVERPLERLFICFARELVRAAALSEHEGISQIRIPYLEQLSDLVASIAPWYVSPGNPTDLVQLESAMSKALRIELTAEHSTEFNALDAFEQLASTARQLVEGWDSKLLLFLLDDVSLRFLSSDHVSQVLWQLSLKSEHFGFKISTETSSQLLSTPGGAPAHLGRDYDIVDLGREVLENLAAPRGKGFIEGILMRREAFLASPRTHRGTPSKILGQQTLQDIAGQLLAAKGRQPTYWGLQALAAVCVGNVGDVIAMYDRMLETAGDGPVTKKIQHDVMIDLSEKRLLALAGQDPLLFAHAAAFATASARELQRSDPKRPRQYTQIFVRIEPEHTDKLEKFLHLVDGGVFVFAGNVDRQKDTGALPELQFKLAYNKIFGLARGIPLSMRDRFEPAGGDVPTWLEKPRAELIQPGPDVDPANRSEYEDQDEITETVEPDDTRRKRGSVPPASVPDQLLIEFPAADPFADGLATRVLFDAKCDAIPLIPDSLDWGSATVVAGAGFEERTIGAWQALAGAGVVPGKVLLVGYENRGYHEEILAALATAGVPSIVEREANNEALVDEDLPGGDGPLVLDVTSLTKPLIYSMVRQALRRDRRVHILHTTAGTYDPSDELLRPALEHLDSGQLLEGFEALDAVTSGEGTGFMPQAVGPVIRDSSQASFLAVFTSLKLKRLNALVDNIQVERVAALTSIHESQDRSLRSRATEFISNYLVARFGGVRMTLGTMDAQHAYELLRDLHREHALDGAFNFEITLTGTKMQAVGAGMFAATAAPAAVYYSEPSNRDPEHFTHGTGATRLFRLNLTPRS